MKDEAPAGGAARGAAVLACGCLVLSGLESSPLAAWFLVLAPLRRRPAAAPPAIASRPQLPPRRDADGETVYGNAAKRRKTTAEKKEAAARKAALAAEAAAQPADAPYELLVKQPWAEKEAQVGGAGAWGRRRARAGPRLCAGTLGRAASALPSASAAARSAFSLDHVGTKTSNDLDTVRRRWSSRRSRRSTWPSST